MLLHKMCCDLITLTRLFSFFYEICDCIKTFVCHKNHDDCSEAKFLPIFPTCIDAYCLINIKRQFITISLGLFLGPRSNWPFNNIQNVWKKGQRTNSPARKGMRSHNPWNQSTKLHLVIHQQICITFRFGKCLEGIFWARLARKS